MGLNTKSSSRALPKQFINFLGKKVVRSQIFVIFTSIPAISERQGTTVIVAVCRKRAFYMNGMDITDIYFISIRYLYMTSLMNKPGPDKTVKTEW